MIPTSIDGTDITGATIDGTEVQEITVDGQTVFTAAPELPNSAIHRYKLDEGSGTTFSDSIGNKNGTISGASFTSDPDAVGGFMLSFDGTNDQAQIPNLNPSNFNDLLIAFTVEDNTTNNTNSPWLYFGETGSFGESNIGDVNGGQTRAYVGVSNTIVVVNINTNVFDGNKHRIAFRIHQNSDLAIAVDGVIEDTTPFGTYGPIDDTLYLCHHDRVNNFTNAQLDDIILYTDSSQSTIDDDFAIQPWS